MYREPSTYNDTHKLIDSLAFIQQHGSYVTTVQREGGNLLRHSKGHSHQEPTGQFTILVNWPVTRYNGRENHLDGGGM